MGQNDVRHWRLVPPSEAPSLQEHRDDNWRHFDKFVNAISFGFIATAILICMFLVMAFFERFLMRLPARNSAGGLQSQNQMDFDSKEGHSSSPTIPKNAKEVSVLMPGEDVPTFIAQPTPIPIPIVEHTHTHPRWLLKKDILYPQLITNSSNS